MSVTPRLAALNVRRRLERTIERTKKKNVARRNDRPYVTNAKQHSLDVEWLVRHAVSIQNHYLRIQRWSRTRPAQQKVATPRWSEKDKIERLYREGAMWSEQLGLDLEVDHVVPIMSKVVCGLHVHANLQLLSRDLNSEKGNRHWPDMP